MGVSVRDVAERAGVSVGTVSNVLNRPDRVTPATLAKVRTAIDELGFVRNDAARQLRAGSSRAIGLVVIDAYNPFFGAVSRGAEDRAGDDGLIVLLANSDENPERERQAVDLFAEQRVKGLIISPADDVDEQVAHLRRQRIPVVLIERTSTDPAVPSVAVDNLAGGRAAVEHLVARGRQRLAFAAGQLDLAQVRDRLAGARAAADTVAGVTLEVMDAGGLGVAHGRTVGDAIAARPPSERPDAVFAVNDLVALGVVQGLRTAGLRVPDDVAIVGYDDIDFAASAEVPLTSVRQPGRRIGHTAVDLLSSLIDGTPIADPHVTFQPELIVRASTARS